MLAAKLSAPPTRNRLILPSPLSHVIAIMLHSLCSRQTLPLGLLAILLLVGTLPAPLAAQDPSDTPIASSGEAPSPSSSDAPGEENQQVPDSAGSEPSTPDPNSPEVSADAQLPTNDGPADATPSSTPQPETASAEPEAAAAPAAAKAPSWYDQVDAAFGEYVLKPLVSILFFSFGTENIFGRPIPFVVLWLFAGAVFLTLRMGFINIRAFWHAIRLTKGDYDDKSKPGEVSHFQALSSALSATVGLGNIAGVAIAVGTGGPGAIFWMVIIGLLGMTSKFTECTLGQLYRKIQPDGTVSGGAMHYLKDGLRELGLGPLGYVLAILFSMLCILASFGGGNSFQVGQSLDAIRADVPILQEGQYPVLYGIGMAILTGLVIIGGIKSIGQVASILVPVMCAAYVGMAIYILATNIDEIPAAFGTIVSNAWSLQAGFGGLIGVMVLGIRRAVFSNEAGTGSAAIAHSAAKTDEPVSEGIVALLEPFIDTVIVCTMTGLVIVLAGGTWTPNENLASLKIGDKITVEGKEITVDGAYLSAQPLGSWSNPAYTEHVSTNSGASLTRVAVTSEKGLPAFRWVLYVSVVLFAFSTIVSWSYYGERCWTNLFGPRSSMAYKILFLVFTVLGSVVTKGNILEFSDVLILGMSFPNMLGLYLLSGKVRRELDAYMGKLKSGEIKPHS